MHSDNTLFECKICNKKIKRKSVFRVHMQMHANPIRSKYDRYFGLN